MLQKFFWVVTMLGVAMAASGVVDRRRARRRRELWAEATDQV